MPIVPRIIRVVAVFGMGAALAASSLAVSASVTGQDSVSAGRATCTIHADGLFTYGTKGPDVICGSSRKNVIYARAGNDVILGGDGADLLYGGEGRDRLHGGLGQDQLTGDEGPDLLVASRGDDTLYDALGIDRYIGGPGRDCFLTTDERRAHDKQSERVLGGPGRDTAKTSDADVRRKIEKSSKLGCAIVAISP